MYDFEQIRRGLRHPRLLLLEANKLFHNRGFQREYNPDGIDVFEEEWDTLLVLDACRFDLFAQSLQRADVDLTGRLERRTSRGTDTVEWLRGNVEGRDLDDTVYVTGNPQYERFVEGDPFHDVVNVWREEGGWDDDLNTVRPETMAERVRETAARYPEKRVIGHFIQPHFPFIGPTGREHFDLDGLQFWKQIMLGEREGADDDLLWTAYRETLDLALPHVADLVRDLSGRTVVTSDHGQLFNERIAPVPIRTYGHPRHVYVEELTTVPWFVCEGNRRRPVERAVVGERERDAGAERDEAVDEDGEVGNRTDEPAGAVVEERLAKLGYKP